MASGSGRTKLALLSPVCVWVGVEIKQRLEVGTGGCGRFHLRVFLAPEFDWGSSLAASHLAQPRPASHQVLSVGTALPAALPV